MSKAKLVSAIVVAAVVVIGAGSFGYAALSGGDRADAYEKKFDAWSDEGDQVLTDATKLPPQMFPTQGIKSYQDKKVLAAMTQACEDTSASVKDVEAAVDDLPTLSGSNPLSRLDGDWKAAAKRSDRREDALGDYADALTSLLKRRAADCRFNVQYDQPRPGAAAAQKLINDHDVDSGTTVPNGTGTYTCGKDQDGCIPVDKDDLKQFLAGHTTFVKILADRGTKVGDSTYTESSYKPAAEQIEAYFTLSSKAKKTDIDAMRDFASDLDSRRLISSRSDRDKNLRASYERVFTALARAYPGLPSNSKVKTDPLFSEQFFAAIDTLAVKQVESKRQALLDVKD